MAGKPQEPTDLLVRFSRRITRDSGGCWRWTGQTDKDGYGIVSPYRQNQKKAHRVSFELFEGPIPAGMQIDHLCRVRSCVNPDHLLPVTCHENIVRGDTGTRDARTACPAGHPYDEINTLRNARGHRQCRTCHRERERARRACPRF